MRSERIKRLRTQLGMSPVEFASAIQTSVSSVYRWEKGVVAKVDHVHVSIIEAIEQSLRDLPGERRTIAHNLRVGLRDLVYVALTNRTPSKR